MMAENMHGADNQSTAVNYRWRKEGDGANGGHVLPRALYGQGITGWAVTVFVEDGSFLRLKTVTLGYTFPKALIAKARLTNARVYIAAQNLWTWTSYSGYDPEVSVRNSALTPGLDFSSYPRAYSLSFGVNLGF